MLTYSYQTLDMDFAVAGGNATGEFAEQYVAALNKTAGPNATKKKLTTKATVSHAALVRGNQKRATVLAFLTQSTNVAGSKKTSITRSEIRVDLTRTAEGWFISGIEPL